jgi:hypothetical protein
MKIVVINISHHEHLILIHVVVAAHVFLILSFVISHAKVCAHTDWSAGQIGYWLLHINIIESAKFYINFVIFSGFKILVLSVFNI